MFRKILFPLDVQEPEFARAAFAEALRLAEGEGAELHLLTVIPGYGLPMVADFFPDDAGPRARSECERLSAKFVADNAAGKTVTLHPRPLSSRRILCLAPKSHAATW